MPADLIAVLSHAVTDEVYAPTGDLRTRAIGGAGAFAATGASLASGPGRTALVSGVGAADRARFTAWCRAREVDAAGLFTVGEHSPVTRVDYHDDGERVERSLLGAAHFASHTPLPRHLPMPLDRLAGCYLFHDAEPPYWAEVADLLGRWRGVVLWEVAANACVPKNRSVVRELADQVDVLSLNVAEADALLGSHDLGEVASLLRPPGGVLALRRGASGSVVVTDGAAWAVGVPAGPVVDPTGGGNAYSGTFLASYLDTGDAVAAARTAAAAAAEVIAQTGAPAVDEATRARLRTTAGAVPVTRIDT